MGNVVVFKMLLPGTNLWMTKGTEAISYLLLNWSSSCVGGVKQPGPFFKSGLGLLYKAANYNIDFYKAHGSSDFFTSWSGDLRFYIFFRNYLSLPWVRDGTC